MRTGTLVAFALGLALASPFSTPSAQAADSAFEELSGGGSDEDLARTLGNVYGRLTRGESRVRVKSAGLVFCSAASAARREERAGEVADAIRRGVAALAKAGLAKEDGVPSELVVVEVRTPGEPSRAVRTKDGAAMLLRSGERARESEQRGRLPRLAERDDGPIIQRDALQAAGRLRVELWRRASGLGPESTSVADLFAAHLLDWRAPDEEAPAWLVSGLGMWLSSQIDGAAIPAPGHRCGGTDEGLGLAAVMDAEGAPDPSARAHMARLIELGVSRGVNLADAAAVFAGADQDSAVFEKAFGLPLAEAEKLLTPAGADDGACESGTIECTLCRGKGELQIACVDCAGTAVVGCTSCRGSQACPSGTCIRGWHYYSDQDRKEKCRYCGGKGTANCKACGGKGGTKCPVCRSGKVSRDCPGCDKGRLPCPDGGVNDVLARLCGESDDAVCPLCAVDVYTACDTCGGTGNEGCGDCRGRSKQLCPRCRGDGIRLMVYDDGTIASSSKCDRCNGKGGLPCDGCRGGKIACRTCSKKGKVKSHPDDCVLCEGKKRVPDISDTIVARRKRLAPPSAEEGDSIRETMDEGIDFLLTCNKTKSGAFALREFRRSKDKGARPGKLNDPTLFSNAQALWALSTLGVGKDDERVAGAWKMLRKQAQDLVDKRVSYRGTQHAALALRALVGGGEDTSGKLVKGLVTALVKGQRPDGFWAESLDSDEDGEAFEALFAAESLWLAQLSGAKVPRATFAKTFRAANKLFGARGIKGHDDFLTGTTVASLTALVVIAKAGELAEDSGSFRYDELQGVQRGLAWLDRYFDIREEPAFSDGAKLASTSDAGYSAYLFAIQRLAMLLNIEILAGERWYATGSRHLMEIQFDDGSFEETSRFKLNGPVRTTCSALLFLGRVTPAVTER